MARARASRWLAPLPCPAPPAAAVVAAGLVAALAPPRAAADPVPADPIPITDREYAIDFYDGVAIGDTAQVGMGGAGASHVLGSAGALLNAAAPAVRRSTDGDRWSWDYHVDVLTGRYSTDYDNNGAATGESSGASLLTAGLAVRVGDWAGAATVTLQRAGVDAAPLTAEAVRGKVVLARWLPRLDLAVGLGVQTIGFQLTEDGGAPLFEITGAGLVAGATWVPAGERFRAGVALESPIAGGTVEAQSCDPADCRGYILPRRVVAAARAITGVSYRWGATAWNQPVRARFRDERAVIVAGDLVLTGAVEDGHGIEAFAMRELQRSGRAAVASVRAGAEVEWLPGRLRVRGGAYWEPGRFDGVGGRLHGTLGADVRVLELRAYGLRRGRISVTADLAPRYRNLAVSIGFWR